MNGENEKNDVKQKSAAPNSTDKPVRALQRRRLWKRYRWMLWLLLLIPFIYMAVQIFIILSPNPRYETARLYSMTDSLSVTGQVVLNSEPIYNSGSGFLYYTIPAGQRVAADAEVALMFESEAGVQAMDTLKAIDEELELLYEAQEMAAEGGDLDLLLGQIQQGTYGMLAAVENGSYADVDDPKNQTALAANKMQIATGAVLNFEERINYLTAEKTRLEGIATPTGSIATPQVGYFVPSSLVDYVPVEYETIASYTPQQLSDALQREYPLYGEEVVGHIVLDYKWYFFTTVSAKDADKFVVGDKSLQLRFPDVSDAAIPITVSSVTVDEQNNVAAVELYCEYISPEVLSLRREKAEIIFGTQKGIRIEKNALRMVDVENEDGSVNTYRGVYIEFGNMIYFRRVDILLEDEAYILVSDTAVPGVNEVQLYDKIIVDPGGMELYDGKIR